MKRTSSWPFFIRGAGLATVVVCALWLTGCTPKRVVDTEILTESPRPQTVRKPSGTITSPGSLAPKPVTPKSRSGGLGPQAVALAQKQMGKMYQWGGQGPDRFDCSGLVYFVYGNLGVSMPRVSSQQAKVGQEVSRKNLQPGDLLYFNTSGSGINHVGIYVGQSKFIHAPRKGMPVRTDSLNNGWWKQKLRGARRIRS